MFWTMKLISTHQSGFRSLHSTVTALFEATDIWAFNIDRGNVKKGIWLCWSWTFTEYKELL